MIRLVVHEILSVRIEDVQKDARFLADAAVDHVVHLKQGVALFDNALDAVDLELEHAAHDVGDLGVGMMMKRSDRSLLDVCHGDVSADTFCVSRRFVSWGRIY